MDWNDIDRLRDPGFTLERRGYDRREVDRLLGSVADWLETDAVKEIEELSVKRKLEHVGKSTARILVVAEEEAAKLRDLTEQECGELRSEAQAASEKQRTSADEYAKNVRAKADEYAKSVRAKADEDAGKLGEKARADAARVVEEAERRRVQIEAAVVELEARRDRTIEQLDRLRSALSSTLGTEEPAAPKRKPAAKPAEKDGAVVEA
jgi:cell division septum initiation protein DivIVA